MRTDLAKDFVTRMLTRDLCAVANLLGLYLNGRVQYTSPNNINLR